MPAWRVVASPAALDALVAPEGTLVLRIAPDDVLLIGGLVDAPLVDDPHAIVVPDAGWSAATFGWDDVERVVQPVTEWIIPAAGLAQGSVAFVPVKLWITDDGVQVVCPTAYAHELEERLA